VPASATATGSGERRAGDSHSGDSCSNQRNRKERLIALGHRISPYVFRRSGHRFVASGNLKFAAPGRCDGHHNFADSSGWRLLYEFALTKSGTFMYHPHSGEMVQMAMGMMGCSSCIRAIPPSIALRTNAFVEAAIGLVIVAVVGLLGTTSPNEQSGER
jgi:hypothetical protein